MQAVVTFLILSLGLFSSPFDFAHAEDVHLDLTEERLAKRINAFGCNFLRGVSENTAAEDNILVSPVSAFTALALLHSGADDSTLTQLADVMKVSEFKKFEIQDKLHKILSKISSNSSEHVGKPAGFETVLANGMFMQNDFPIENSYIQSVKNYFYGEVQNVDFKNKAQESLNIINDWISKSTKGRIDKFYEEPLSPNTIAVLASALYFNAKWKYAFKEEDTKTEKFTTNSMEIQVPMMNLQRDMYYVNDDTLHYDSVTLPYADHEYELTVYLQHTQHGEQKSLSHLYHKLVEQNFVAKTAQRRVVHLQLPKMKLAWKKSVVDALKLESIFSSAHMAEMTSVRNVTISDMTQATDLEVNEEGTVATVETSAHVTYTSDQLESSKGQPIMFHVDRPFLMTITHKPTQTILFTGIIRKPIA